jgi:hypothetical protein
MVSVMVPPIGTVVAGVNTRTGCTQEPATPPEVMELNKSPVIAAASRPGVKLVSALDESWKPPVTIARAPPRMSPHSVIVMAAVPVAAPAVVSMIEVLVAVAAGVEVAVKDATLLVKENTDLKK